MAINQRANLAKAGQAFMAQHHSDPVTIDGVSYTNVAVNLGTFTRELGGGGFKRVQMIELSVSKVDMPDEPAFGLVIVHDGAKYKIEEVRGRLPQSAAWRITGADIS